MVKDIAITILNMIMLISTITASTVLIINTTGKINILGNPNTEMTTIAMSPNAKRNSHRKISKSAVKDKRYRHNNDRKNTHESDSRLV